MKKINLRYFEIILLILTLFICSALIYFENYSSKLATILLCFGIIISGHILIKNLTINLKDDKLYKLNLLWPIKFLTTILFLIFGWIPELVIGLDNSAGYDPARFYVYVGEILAPDWSVTNISLNYIGIIYYYATFAFIFGHNPFVPAIINSFVTLVGVLLIIRFTYLIESKKNRSYIAYLILIPEVIWFDALTSRETLVANLLSVTMLTLGLYILNGKINFKALSIIFTGILGIILIRSSMLLPVLLFVITLVLIPSIFYNRTSKYIIYIGALMLVGALVIAQYIQSIIGGYFINYRELFLSLINIEHNIANSMEWSERSVAALLMPTNLLTAVIYTPLRMLMYVVAPLPGVNINFDGILRGNYVDFQNSLTSLTAIIIIVGFPYVLAGSHFAWKCRRKLPILIIIPVAFWSVAIAVSGGNLIIHERYRVMFDFLLFSTMWLGYSQCSNQVVVRWACIWFSLLFTFTFFYISYKFF
jgi:hypothetical protein